MYTLILDDFKFIIDKVLNEANAPATGIYYMIKEKYGFKGSYSTVKRYVTTVKENIINDLKIRFNTIPGYQAQVDWKETITLYSITNEKYTFNIFLIVLGCSRMKYIELTEDRSQLRFNNISNNLTPKQIRIKMFIMPKSINAFFL